MSIGDRWCLMQTFRLVWGVFRNILHILADILALGQVGGLMLYLTRSQIMGAILSQNVSKILTACRLKRTYLLPTGLES